MAFMEPFTYGPMAGVEVETRNDGTMYFPADVWDDVRGEYDIDQNPATLVTPIHGYFGRYSAPGYLDCTDWHFDTSLEVLEAELQEMYGDDDDDDDEAPHGRCVRCGDPLAASETDCHIGGCP